MTIIQVQCRADHGMYVSANCDGDGPHPLQTAQRLQQLLGVAQVILAQTVLDSLCTGTQAMG